MQNIHPDNIFGVIQQKNRISIVPIRKGDEKGGDILLPKAETLYQSFLVGTDIHLRVHKGAEEQRTALPSLIDNFWSYTQSRLKKFYGVPKKILEEISYSPKNSLGEFVVIIDGEKNIKDVKKNQINSDVEKIIKKLLFKFSLTETVAIVHKISYIEKKQIYKKALDIKNGNN